MLFNSSLPLKMKHQNVGFGGHLCLNLSKVASNGVDSGWVIITFQGKTSMEMSDIVAVTVLDHLKMSTTTGKFHRIDFPMGLALTNSPEG